MKRGLVLDLASLPELPLARLRVLWAEHMCRAEPPSQKCLLIRELAWRVQARTKGGLDAQTRRLLAAAVREAMKCRPLDREGASEPTAPHVEAAGSAAPTSRRRVTRRSTAAVVPATRLIRVWRGATHEVHAMKDGSFRYRGQTFKSLSEIARAITGTRWSGPRFFGLTTRGAVGPASTDELEP
jgi:hypothetical protein